MTIFERIKPLVAERLGIAEDEITLDADFKNDLGADSLDVVEFIMEVEDEFEIEIGDEDAEAFKTIGDCIEYIESRMK